MRALELGGLACAAAMIAACASAPHDVAHAPSFAASEPQPTRALDVDAPGAQSSFTTETVPGVAMQDAAVTTQDPVPPAQTPAAPAQEPVVSEPTPPAPEGEVHGPVPPPAYPIHGRLSTVYRGRASGPDHDHDLGAVLSVDFGDPSLSGWTGHLMTRLNADLDGKPDGPSPFSDLNDTYDAFLVPHLYDAWAEKRDVGALEYVRIGRQSLWDTPVFAWFDGLGIETQATQKNNVKAGLYGGIPVHLYESSHSGDAMAGVYAEGEPWKGGRVRLDWMHLEDESESGSHQNDLLRASGWQSFGRNLRVDGWFSGLDGEERDYMARATWTDAESDFTVSASWFELLTTQQDRALEIDPYFTTLGELFPYHQGRVMASKGISENVNVQGGLDVRDVTDDGDEGQFNRDSTRIFATTTLTKVLPGALDMNLTAEKWDGDGSDINTWGFDLSRHCGAAFDASLGSYYSLYKVESTLDEERDHVRTFYVGLRWKRTASTTWDARYDIEDAADTTYQTLRVGLTWAF